MYQLVFSSCSAATNAPTISSIVQRGTTSVIHSTPFTKQYAFSNLSRQNDTLSIASHGWLLCLSISIFNHSPSSVRACRTSSLRVTSGDTYSDRDTNRIYQTTGKDTHFYPRIHCTLYIYHIRSLLKELYIHIQFAHIVPFNHSPSLGYAPYVKPKHFLHLCRCTIPCALISSPDFTVFSDPQCLHFIYITS